MRFQKLISTALTILLTVATVQAEVVAGRWEKVQALPPGSAIIVSLVGGERFECTFNKIESDEILFNELNGKERRIPKGLILKIESAAVVHDRLRNGILIGTLVGAAVGITGMVAYGNSTTNGPVGWGDEEGPAYLLGSALVGGGIGAATGAIIDASIKHREVFYRAK
jgi:hypothetical protein